VNAVGDVAAAVGGTVAAVAYWMLPASAGRSGPAVGSWVWADLDSSYHWPWDTGVAAAAADRQIQRR